MKLGNINMDHKNEESYGKSCRISEWVEQCLRIIL